MNFFDGFSRLVNCQVQTRWKLVVHVYEFTEAFLIENTGGRADLISSGAK